MNSRVLSFKKVVKKVFIVTVYITILRNGVCQGGLMVQGALIRRSMILFCTSMQDAVLGRWMVMSTRTGTFKIS